MICYAIKNEEGMYLIIGDNGYPEQAVYDIGIADFFKDYELAKSYCPSRCKVVKVEIREVDDEN